MIIRFLHKKGATTEAAAPKNANSDLSPNKLKKKGFLTNYPHEICIFANFLFGNNLHQKRLQYPCKKSLFVYSVCLAYVLYHTKNQMSTGIFENFVKTYKNSKKL